MEQYQDVFKRVEAKYLLSLEQYAALGAALAPHMQPDGYGEYTVCNIYYDTEDFALIRESLDKPVYKEKLRVRSYGRASEDKDVFVEIKKKFKGVVYKRRVAMKPRDAEHFLASGMMRAPMEQIHREIAYFLTAHRVSPRVYLAYDRTALCEKNGGELRLTFDKNIRFRTDELDLTKDTRGTPILAPDEVLMEIKIPGAMPVWLSQTLSELKIYPTSYSKYGRCYENYLIREFVLKGGLRYAA